MTDLERDVLRARDIGLTDKEVARYVLVSEEKVQRIIEINELHYKPKEEAVCQKS